MRVRLTGLVVGFFVICWTLTANATSIGFDDQVFFEDSSRIISPYMGLTWENAVIGDEFWHQWGPATSGGFYMFNGKGLPATISGIGFNFTGAYLSGAYKDGLSVQVIGKSGGITLYDTTVVTVGHSPTWFQFDYKGIDELTLSAFGGVPIEPHMYDGNTFVLDDFTYEPVPEPSTFALLLAGMVVMVMWRRQRV